MQWDRGARLRQWDRGAATAVGQGSDGGSWDRGRRSVGCVSCGGTGDGELHRVRAACGRPAGGLAGREVGQPLSVGKLAKGEAFNCRLLGAGETEKQCSRLPAITGAPAVCGPPPRGAQGSSHNGRCIK